MIHAWLMANVNVSRAVQRRSSHWSSLEDNLPLIYGLLSIATFWTCLFIWDTLRDRKQHRRVHPPELFRQLCRTHKLDRAQQKLLWSIARDLPQPTVIFVQPQQLDAYADRSDANSALIASLKRRLFGEVPSAQRSVAAAAPLRTTRAE
ncbi:MAG: hypothetical protein ABGZ17_20605 [Planctomycetaceae bacterium]